MVKVSWKCTICVVPKTHTGGVGALVTSSHPVNQEEKRSSDSLAVSDSILAVSHSSVFLGQENGILVKWLQTTYNSVTELTRVRINLDSFAELR